MTNEGYNITVDSNGVPVGTEMIRRISTGPVLKMFFLTMVSSQMFS